MFKINPAPTFTHTVPVHVPVNGGHERQTMQVTYRVIEDEVAETFDLSGLEGIRGFLDAVVERIDDLQDEAGQEVSWNDQVKRHLLGLAYVRIALLRGYNGAMVDAKLGN